MRKLLLILILLGSGCVSTGDVRDFTYGAAEGIIMQSDPSFYQQQQQKKQLELQRQQLQEMRRQTQALEEMQMQKRYDSINRQLRYGY